VRIAAAVLAASTLAGFVSGASGTGQYGRRSLPPARYALNAGPHELLHRAAAGRDPNAGWYQTQAACAALSIRTAVYSASASRRLKPGVGDNDLLT
jgi:hypothetical protein